MARKSASKEIKSHTVKEFKAWLSGILEFQSNDWVPNLDQWKTIQEKINSLKDEIISDYISNTEKSDKVIKSINNPSTSNQLNIPVVHAPAESLLMDRGSLLSDPIEEFIPPAVPIYDPTIPGSIPSVETVSSRIIPSNKPTIPGNKYISQDPSKSKFL